MSTFAAMFGYDDEPYEGDHGYDDERDDEPGCIFPGRCVMPGEHLVSECATADMMGQSEREERGES